MLVADRDIAAAEPEDRAAGAEVGRALGEDLAEDSERRLGDPRRQRPGERRRADQHQVRVGGGGEHRLRVVDELLAMEQRPRRGVAGLGLDLQPVVVLAPADPAEVGATLGARARARQAARRAFASGEILRKKKRSRVRT